MTLLSSPSGRTAGIGHSPYVMTPLQLQRAGDPVGRQIPSREIPSSWMNAVSVYGPVATAAEWGAAELGGTSLARITFWLKLEEALGLGRVHLQIDGPLLLGHAEPRVVRHVGQRNVHLVQGAHRHVQAWPT